MTKTDYSDIFRAVSRQDAGVLRELIAAGGDVNAPDPRPFIGHMNTPLHQAAGARSAELVRILLDAGAHVEVRCADGWTPLMRACNAGEFEVAKLLVDAGADIDAKNREGYTAYGRIPGNAPELMAFVELHHALRNIGIMLPAAIAIQSAASRHTGVLVICGPAGAGKTTLAEVLKEHTGVTMLGDLRVPEEIVQALDQAQRESVVCVVRSGESFGLWSRWRDMGIPEEFAVSASVTTITLRRLPRAAAGTVSTDLLAVEVLGPDGLSRTGSLAEQAKTLVSAGLATDEAARFHVPGYE